MELTCENCQEKLEKYLCDIPAQWRKQIVYVICEGISKAEQIDCRNLKKCQTITFLSAFTKDNCSIFVSYRNEANITKNVFFNYCELIDRLMDEVDPKCLASEENWLEMSHEHRMQLILNELASKKC